LEGCEVWLAFGHNKYFRYIAAHTIAAELGDDWYKGLLFMLELERKLFGILGGLYQT